MHVTGLLLFVEGMFIQLLEGEKLNVGLIYKSIEKDLRHKNIIKLVTDEYEKRMFPNWSMGYSVADKTIAEQMRGYVDPNKPGLLKSDVDNPAISVLKTFAESNNIATR